MSADRGAPWARPEGGSPPGDQPDPNPQTQSSSAERPASEHQGATSRVTHLFLHSRGCVSRSSALVTPCGQGLHLALAP